MIIRLITGRIRKTSKHRRKVEIPRWYNKCKPKIQDWLVVKKWNIYKFEETPLMKMMRL